MKVNILLLICLLSFTYSFAQTPAYISTQNAREDIHQIITTFERVHYNPYFKTSKEDFKLYKEGLLGSWPDDSISYKQFIRTGMKLAAKLSGGHSQMDWQNERITPEIKSHTYIPFTGKLNAKNQFIVTRSYTEQIKVGDEIQSINGFRMENLYQECMAYTGGIEAFKNANTEILFPLYLFFNDSIKAPFSFQTSKNQVTHSGMDFESLKTFVNSSRDQTDYSFRILDGDIGLITYNMCQDYKKFNKFLTATFQTIAEKDIQHLIVDIRENGGGDSSLNDLLLSYLTKKPYRQSSGRYWKVSAEAKKSYSQHKAYVKLFGKDFMEEYMHTPNGEVIESLDGELTTPNKPKNYFDGKVCFLIGPMTFSSANFLADAVKTYTDIPLIGQATGEYTNDFGEQLNFQLTHSGSYMFVSSTYDIGANGNAKVLEPVYPDIQVNDDALDYASSWIKENNQ